MRPAPKRLSSLALAGLVSACGSVTLPEPRDAAPTDAMEVAVAPDALDAVDAAPTGDVDDANTADVTTADAPTDAPIDAPPRDASPARDAPAASVTVRITAPASGATVSGVVPFTAVASATAGVARVAFYSAGGGYRIAEDTTAPYAVDWHTAGSVPDGMQRLRAVAFDRDGRQATAEVTVMVRNPPATTLPAAEVARVTAWFEARRGARYMEGNCQPTTYPGWAGIPIQLCRYRVSDSFSGGTRVGEVILANAEPAQLARWVVQAAIERRGRLLRGDVDALCDEIIGQSGAQFPVAGVVYEDMDGTGQRIYPFRNGVTVRVEGLPFATREQPSAAQMAAYRTGAVAFVGTYGRIAGTTPAQWTALTREAVPADRSTWPDIVGRAYRAAWGNDRNALIVARARALP